MNHCPPHPNENAGFVAWLRRCWWILRQVLRGYLSGQPLDDERPRKGCC